MRKPKFSVTIRRLMFVVAIFAILFGAAIAYVRTRRAPEISIPNARAVFTAIEPDVKSLMFSDDGALLAAAGAQGSIQFWHTSTTWDMASTPVSLRAFYQMAISPDGQWMAVADAGAEEPSVRQSVLRCFRLERGFLPLAEMGSIRMRSDVADPRRYAGRALAFSPDGRSIASGGLNTVEIRERSSLRLAKTMRGAFAIPQLLAYSHDGKFLAVGGHDGTVALIDPHDGAQKFVCPPPPHQIDTSSGSEFGHHLGVTTLVFCCGDSRLISLGGDNYVKVWNATTGGLITQMRIGDLSGWADRRSVVAVSVGEKSILTASKTAELQLWDLDTGQSLNKTMIPPVPLYYYIEELAVSRDGRALAAAIVAAGQPSRIILWSISDLFAVQRQPAAAPVIRR
jgi:WD40 repeat protein